jgi:hypothetical protein
MGVEWKADRTESPEVKTWRVLALVGGFLAFTALLWSGLHIYYESALTTRLIDLTPRDFPAPRLQPNPNQDYLNFHAAQMKELAPEAAPATGPRISMDAAMAQVIARGAQAYDPPEGTPPVGPALATGAAMDGAPRATRSAPVAPYGKTQ